MNASPTSLNRAEFGSRQFLKAFQRTFLHPRKNLHPRPRKVERQIPILILLRRVANQSTQESSTDWPFVQRLSLSFNCHRWGVTFQRRGHLQLTTCYPP